MNIIIGLRIEMFFIVSRPRWEHNKYLYMEIANLINNLSNQMHLDTLNGLHFVEFNILIVDIVISNSLCVNLFVDFVS